MILLDGALGTELAARGIALPAPRWTAAAIEGAPEVVATIHRAYADAGADVHTAGTFRTTARASGPGWEALLRRAVDLARSAARPGQRVAGSLAPLEDCYRPDLSPADPRPEHRAAARALAAAGADLVLCETFPHTGEALVAVEEAVATGKETWLALTAGPDADLLTPAAMAACAREAARRGARAVLVDCTPASRTLAFVEAIASAGVPFGAYANAGAAEEGFGWTADPATLTRYAEIARSWLGAGATIVGGCCGTTPAHVARLRSLVDARADAG